MKWLKNMTGRSIPLRFGPIMFISSSRQTLDTLPTK